MPDGGHAVGPFTKEVVELLALAEDDCHNSRRGHTAALARLVEFVPTSSLKRPHSALVGARLDQKQHCDERFRHFSGAEPSLGPMSCGD
jgi:hypothetical protein